MTELRSACAYDRRDFRGIYYSSSTTQHGTHGLLRIRFTNTYLDFRRPFNRSLLCVECHFSDDRMIYRPANTASLAKLLEPVTLVGDVYRSTTKPKPTCEVRAEESRFMRHKPCNNSNSDIKFNCTISVSSQILHRNRSSYNVGLVYFCLPPYILQEPTTNPRNAWSEGYTLSKSLSPALINDAVPPDSQ